MKMKNIFIALMVVLTAAVACVKEETGLTEIKVSKSFVNIPLEGGSDAITLKTTGDWSLAIKWPTIKVDDKYVEDKWFNVTTEQKGEEEIITFSAEEAASYRSLDIKLHCNGQTQIIKVAQGKDVPVPVTIAELLAEKTVGKVYKLSNVTVDEITNMKYGGMNISDETGKVFVYGTLDKSGKGGNFPSMGINAGDKLTIKAKWSSHDNLENSVVLEHIPSFVSLGKGMNSFSVGTEAKDLEIKLKVTGESLDVNPVILVKEGEETVEKPCDWISIMGINVVEGNGVVKLRVAANEGALSREAKVFFVSGKEGKEPSKVATTILQEGKPVTIAEAKSLSYVNVTGVVVGISTNGYILKDKTASIFVYNKEAKFAVGTTVQVIGSVSGWNYGAQIKPDIENAAEGTVEVAHGDAVVLDPAKLDEIAALTDGKDKVKDLVIDCQYVKITGKLTQSKGSKGQTYWNIIVPNSDKKGSGYGLSEEMAEKATPFIDKDVDIHGYLVQVSNGKYFNIVVTGIAAVSATPDPETPTGNEATLDCTAAGFAEWSSSYTEHTQDFEKATVTYEEANKQPETNAISDCPVTRGKSITVTMKEKLTMKSVDFTFKQWGTKKQTATLHTSTNGVDFTATTITSDNFALSSAKLPEGTKAVKVTFGNGNQIGIKSIKVGF